MNNSKNEYDEACRLAFKFFPEASRICQKEKGLYWQDFLLAMNSADLSLDWSCDPYSPGNCSSMREFHEEYKIKSEAMFSSTGGFEGTDEDIYCRLLEHIGLSPSGRVIVISEATSRDYWPQKGHFILICDSSRIPERFREMEDSPETKSCFISGDDALFVFESGSAILIDHDERIFWANSKIRSIN